MNSIFYRPNQQRCIQLAGQLALWMGVALLVVACGGGGGTSRITSSTLTPDPNAAVNPDASTVSVTISGTARAIANKLNFYQANVVGGTALAVIWVWGDGPAPAWATRCLKSGTARAVSQVWSMPPWAPKRPRGHLPSSPSVSRCRQASTTPAL